MARLPVSCLTAGALGTSGGGFHCLHASPGSLLLLSAVLSWIHWVRQGFNLPALAQCVWCLGLGGFHPYSFFSSRRERPEGQEAGRIRRGGSAKESRKKGSVGKKEGEAGAVSSWQSELPQARQDQTGTMGCSPQRRSISQACLLMGEG